MPRPRWRGAKALPACCAAALALVLLGCPAGRDPGVLDVNVSASPDGRAPPCPAILCGDAPSLPTFDGAGGDDGRPTSQADGGSADSSTADSVAATDAGGDVSSSSGFVAIELVALDQAFKGNLGGAIGADALCAAQAAAAKRAGLFRAFVSAAGRNVRDLVAAQHASLPVVDSKGAQLFASWSAIFSTSTWPAGATIYTFGGAKVDQATGPWQDGNLWHGSRPDGQLLSGSTCNDWTSDRLLVRGMSGEVDRRELLKQERRGCHRRHAVICVRIN